MNKKLFMIILGFCLSLIILSSLTYAYNIDKCSVLSSSGEYFFNDTIIADTQTYCLNITSSNIIIYGDGYGYVGDGNLTKKSIKAVNVDNVNFIDF